MRVAGHSLQKCGGAGERRLIGTVSVCYWLIVTAIFTFYTFGPYGNAQAKYSWFIWAIAGILYGAVMAVLRLVGQGEKKK